MLVVVRFEEGKNMSFFFFFFLKIQSKGIERPGKKKQLVNARIGKTVSPALSGMFCVLLCSLLT